MSSRKLLSRTHFNPMPPIIRNSLHWSQEPTNQMNQSNPPFLSKGPNHSATNLDKSRFEMCSAKEGDKVFDEMPQRDVVAWTAMITRYNSCGHYTAAWAVFCEMLRSDTKPNAFTFSSVLKACKGTKALSCGAMVHGSAVKCGMKGSIYVENALMDMYATCSVSMDDACKVFSDLEEKNDVTWTTLITGYTHRDDGYNALQVFRKMLLEEVEPDPFSFSIAIKACASIGSQSFGMQMHSAVIKYACESVTVMNAILDMYCRFGCLSEASQYFDEMSQKDLITWNALISGYEKSDPKESLRVFSRMESEGFSPNGFTFSSVTVACANLAVLNCGEQVHGVIIRRGFNKNLAVSNTLINMYAKCGSITNSHKIFSKMSDRNVVTWTSMMIGYGDHGYGKEAVELFDEMVKSGIRPDHIVFMAVLSACSHAGLVDEGLGYFKSLIKEYKVTPDREIYSCVVDLLCRAGRIEEAYDLIESMPYKPDESVWSVLLGACRDLIESMPLKPDESVLSVLLGVCKAHKLRHLSRLAAQRMLDLRPNMAGTYVVLSNFYAAESKWEESANMRMLMRGMGKKKEAGQSWIEVRNQVYSFVVGDKRGSHIKWVYGVLDFLIWHMKEVEHLSDLDCSIHDQDDAT